MTSVIFLHSKNHQARTSNRPILQTHLAGMLNPVLKVTKLVGQDSDRDSGCLVLSLCHTLHTPKQHLLAPLVPYEVAVFLPSQCFSLSPSSLRTPLSLLLLVSLLRLKKRRGHEGEPHIPIPERFI